MLARRIALAVALIAGLLGSQGPEFAQQYRQRIGGALDELRLIVTQFDDETAKENLTRSEGLRRLQTNSDPLARQRGEDMTAIIARADRLQQQLSAMSSAGPLLRLYVMAKDFDPQIAWRTLDNFEPATPLTLEALTAAGTAALCAWAAARLCAWPFRRQRYAGAARG